MSFDEAVSSFPHKDINRKIPNASYTVWQMLEHMRIAQWDILEFIVNPDHTSPDFPEGYWLKTDKTATVRQWKKTIRDFRNDLKSIENMVKNPETDLFAPIPHARDYTIFREVLLVADHNSFHTGELVTVRRILNLNPVKEY